MSLGWRALALLLAFGAVFWRFHFPDPRFAWTDDFFYYAVPAQHFLAHGSFEFFPGIATNGFHPLWMAVIVALLKIAGNGAGFYGLLSLLSTGCALLCLWQGTALAKDSGARDSLAQAAGWLSFLVALCIGSSGMEVTLAMPLLLILLRRLRDNPLGTSSAALVTGVLTGLTILSRLDVALLLMPLAIQVMVTHYMQWRRLLPFTIGTIPFWLYGAVNRAQMGVVLPVSGLAKQLRDTPQFSWEPIHAMLFTNGPAILLLCGFLLVLLLVSLPGRESTRQSSTQTLAYMGGFFLFYATHATLSNWQLWFWYTYPFVAVAPLAVGRLSPYFSIFSSRIFICMVMLLAGTFISGVYRHQRPEYNRIFLDTQEILPFVAAHPGRYAMGDRAGTAGMLLPVPILQLEGLMGDAAFLQHIRVRTPLSRVLHEYGIDYYIATTTEKRGECWYFREPAQAGIDSPIMQGMSCHAPAFIGRYVTGMKIFRAADVQ